MARLSRFIGAVFCLCGLCGLASGQVVPKPDEFRNDQQEDTLNAPIPQEIDWPAHRSAFEKELAAAQTSMGPLQAMLTSDDPYVRKRALEGMALDGSQDSVIVCLSSLADPDVDVRLQARTALSEMNGAWVAADVKRVMAGAGPDLMDAVDEALPALKGTLESPFLSTLNDPQEPRLDRLIAAYCLGRMGSSKAVPALSQGAWSSDREYSEYCAYALTNIVDPASVLELADMTEHENPEIRWAALQGLGAIGGPDALARLRLVAEGHNETDLGLRREALYMLARLGDRDSIPTIMGVMDQGGMNEAAMRAMQHLTGLFFNSTRRWREWYESVKQEFRPPPLLPAGSGPVGFPQDFSFLATPIPGEDEMLTEEAPQAPAVDDTDASTPPVSAPSTQAPSRGPQITSPSGGKQYDVPESMRRALERLSNGDI